MSLIRPRSGAGFARFIPIEHNAADDARHLEHVRLVSEHGERMPAKSTYFYPKLLSGMAVHLLE